MTRLFFFHTHVSLRNTQICVTTYDISSKISRNFILASYVNVPPYTSSQKVNFSFIVLSFSVSLCFSISSLTLLVDSEESKCPIYHNWFATITLDFFMLRFRGDRNYHFFFLRVFFFQPTNKSSTYFFII